jgi:hypothetical protein
MIVRVVNSQRLNRIMIVGRARREKIRIRLITELNA